MASDICSFLLLEPGITEQNEQWLSWPSVTAMAVPDGQDGLKKKLYR